MVKLKSSKLPDSKKPLANADALGFLPLNSLPCDQAADYVEICQRNWLFFNLHLT